MFPLGRWPRPRNAGAFFSGRQSRCSFDPLEWEAWIAGKVLLPTQSASYFGKSCVDRVDLSPSKLPAVKDVAGGVDSPDHDSSSRPSYRDSWPMVRTLSLLLALFTAFASQSAHSVIFGVDARNHPIARSSVILRNATGTFCTAVLIDSVTALTAGFCVDGNRDQTIELIEGGVTVRIPVRATSIHPNFRRDAARLRVSSTDAAIIRLARSVPSTYRGAQLTYESPNVGDRIQVAGFGVTIEGNTQSVGNLNYADLQYVEPYGRGALIAWAQDAQPGQSGVGRGVCNGDAGGALMLANGANAGRVFAISTWSTGPAGKTCGLLTQGVRLSALREWIAQTQQAWGDAVPRSAPPAAAPSPTAQPAPAQLFAPTASRYGVSRLGYNMAGEMVVKISGVLTRDAIGEFQQAVGDERLVTVLLEGPGGNLSAGVEIGNRIRLRGYRTAVAPNSMCASACAIAWLGGTPRHLDVSSRVGFHAAYTDDNGKLLESGVANALVGAYANRIGLTDRSIVFITSAGPSEMNWLQTNAAGAYGLDYTTDASQHTALR